MNLLTQALIFATLKHDGQPDKANKAYILHPLRVMSRFDDEKEQVTALLHDVMEDCNVKPEELLAMNFPKDVVDALILLTHQENEPYDEYIARILKNELACKVKLADLEDNMNLERLPVVEEKDLKRLRKYQKAHKRISERNKPD